MIYYNKLQAQSFAPVGPAQSDGAWAGWSWPDPARRADFVGLAMRFARSSPLLLVGFLVAVICKAGPQPKRAVRSPEPAPAAAEFRGSGSCSAVASHGSIAPRAGLPVLGNEHTTRISNDRHSRAYQTLFTDRSDRIMRNLAGNQPPYKPAGEDERCLACHTTPRSEGALPSTTWMNQDGVGCESCHGASARWLGPHTTQDWRQIEGPSQKEAFGLANTKNLAVRARVCAGCHVGDSSASGLLARDVNHDLIAAGHPRLNFELSAYLANMPPHWIEKGENGDPTAPSRRASSFPVRAWAIGQLATAQASLELLESRARPGNSSWPEFTEYGCFSCHHDLRDEKWRRQRPAGPARGAPAWGFWTMPMSRELANGFIADPAAGRFTESVDKLAALMAQTMTERTRIAAHSREAAEALGRCLEVLASKPFDAREVETLLGIVNRPGAWNRVSTWDEAVQRYLALVPLYQAKLALAPDQAPKLQSLRHEIDGLLEKLKFQPDFDSPSGFDPTQLP